jgi:hypothetical protein
MRNWRELASGGELDDGRLMVLSAHDSNPAVAKSGGRAFVRGGYQLVTICVFFDRAGRAWFRYSIVFSSGSGRKYGFPAPTHYVDYIE